MVTQRHTESWEHWILLVTGSLFDTRLQSNVQLQVSGV
jgi:hypothetical protein